MPRCTECGLERSAQLLYYEVKGFEKPRSQGGTNSLIMRGRTGIRLCLGCLERRRSGGHTQEGLGV